MRKLNIKWLQDCPACNHETAIVCTENGYNNWLYEGDEVSCKKCNHKGLIEVVEDGVVEVHWDGE